MGGTSIDQRTRIVLAMILAGLTSARVWGQEAKPVQPPTAAPAAQPPLPTTTTPEALPEATGRGLPIPNPVRMLLPERGQAINPPGLPQRSGRPRPGSMFDPGAAGPGINQSGEAPFLGGALDPRSGWPFVFLDHFQPRMNRVEKLWVVDTRDCAQEMGSDPWPCLRVWHFNEEGVLERRDPNELLAQVAGQIALVQVQGSLTTPDVALGGMMWTRSWLEYNKVLLPESVVIAFDWPSQRVYQNDVKDINEKGRRAYIAGFHLARFLQGFPASSRVCLLGQSYGGRVVPSATHLLAGGCLNSQDHDEPVRLPGLRPDLQVRAVLIAGASDRQWLDPGKRLDRALIGCEALLNLYNRRDEALRFYPSLVRSDHHRAIGRVGLSNRDLERLGPLAARYAEFDVHEELGREHSLLDAVANPKIARMIAPYLWNPNPPPAPPQTTTEPQARSNQRRRWFGR